MFATCAYPDYQPEFGGIPVRSSNGSPRYKLRYPPFSATLLPAMPSTMPEWPWVKAAHDGRMDQAEFGKRYAEMLSGRVDQVRAEAAKIRQDAGAAEDALIVLMCFCRLDRTGEWCHRTFFGASWTALTGEPAPELGKRMMPEIATDQPQQPGLF